MSKQIKKTDLVLGELIFINFYLRIFYVCQLHFIEIPLMDFRKTTNTILKMIP